LIGESTECDQHAAVKSTRLHAGENSRRSDAGDVASNVLGTLALEIGIVLACAAAIVAVVHYFTRTPSRKAWNEPLSHWTAALRSPLPASRDSALIDIEELGAASPSTVALVAPLVEDSDGDIRVRASAMLIALSRAGTKCADAVEQSMLRTVTSGRTAHARAKAALVLGKTRSDSTSTAALMRAIDDPADEVRAAAAFALGEVVARRPADAMRALLRASQDSAADVRAAALESLRRSWPDDESLLRVAAVALGDTSVVVREQAIQALAGFGARALRYRPDIMIASRDADLSVRMAAKSALERIPLVP
jgi:HEAT repeat protein